MAVNYFLKIEGPTVEGESVVQQHEREIDIVSWTWHMSQSGNMHVPTGGSGKVAVEDVTIVKKVDKASPILMTYCCSGKHFEKATLACAEASGGVPVQYWTLTMEKVIIKDIRDEHAGERANETIALNFAKYKVEYIHQEELGQPGPAITHTWDIAKNQPT
jgi:type VI secretion system secreted protein Hcp